MDEARSQINILKGARENLKGFAEDFLVVVGENFSRRMHSITE